jgi:hypothetical protein
VRVQGREQAGAARAEDQDIGRGALDRCAHQNATAR